MEFLNIGGGELLIIVLLALILFGPEDIIKMMRTLGKYTRQARDMWNQFSATLEQEYSASGELSEVIGETKEVMNTIKTSVNEISTSVSSNVAAAQKTLEEETRESAAALEQTTRLASQAVAGAVAPSPLAGAAPTLPDEAVVDEAEPAVEAEAIPSGEAVDGVDEAEPTHEVEAAPETVESTVESGTAEDEAPAEPEPMDTGAEDSTAAAVDVTDETETATEVAPAPEAAPVVALEGANGSDGDHDTLVASDAATDPDMDLEAVEAGEGQA